MSHKTKPKKDNWYQVVEREVSCVEQPAGGRYIQLCRAIKESENLQAIASTLILEAKKVDESEYTTLNADLFINQCEGDFNKLVSKFKIKQSNPIKVTVPATTSENKMIKELEAQIAAMQLSQETSSSPAVATSSTSTSKTLASVPKEIVESLKKAVFYQTKIGIRVSDEIHVRYNKQTITFKRAGLDGMELSKVDDLIDEIKRKLKNIVEGIYEKAITLRRGGSEVLSPETPIDGLYNTKEEALHVVVVDIPLLNLIVKVPGKELHFRNQRMSSLDDIIKFIKSGDSLAQHIDDDTIFLGGDKKNLDQQHLEAAKESGILEITLSSPNVIDTGSEMHRENLEKAFNVDYIDNFGMKDKFLTYLNRKHKTWNNNTNHYVPYSTIFQSSGYGKSRLIKEVARQIPTVYLCLRDANSTGYPPRTSVGADLFQRVLNDLKEGEEWRFLYVLQAIIQCFNEELVKCECDTQVLWDKQMDTSFCESVWNEIQNRSENWKNILESEVNIRANFITQNNPSDDVCFLFCIDEARALISPSRMQKISPFRLFRRALRKVKWNGFFTLLLDTLSKISNFAPPKSLDPSHWDIEDLSLELFYPYFRLTTTDVFEDNVYEDESWNLAKIFLGERLLGGANNFESSTREISSLAILSSVIGLDISPQSQLASELVASHMATCLFVSEDRERLIIAYPSEPLLSEVAFEFMSDSMLPKILWLFSTLLKKGLVDPGPQGEIVSRIILAVVAHKLRTDGPENTVQKFLTELYHNESVPENLDGFSKEFINGTVAFTHFNVVDYVLDYDDLEMTYMRRCAFIMKRNHPGADICIPVRLTTGKYSIIIIQIKNIDTTSIKGDDEYPASASSKLNYKYVFTRSDLKDHDEPCLYLYWQLGYNYHFQEKPNTVSTRSGQLESKNLHWATFGLRHYKIDDILEIIEDILTSHISPFDSEWKVNNEKDGDTWDGNEIKIIHPVRYRKFKEDKKVVAK
ncbi:14490_t:CDS:2 [Funneliformis mosseae]|uniref:14490_t:CDS:1 n=1 Tax=Funneliformis mosseae TaxID=27381 RepID=A0A9N9GTP4_FUNMO|nr:14490_t:CDS:2 [Funneliformis mosseae]